MSSNCKGAGSDDDSASDVVAQNVVAIFHASFHPTKGNTIDWSLTSPAAGSGSAAVSIDLSGVEFSVLPSGLHLVERDVVYFTHHPKGGGGSGVSSSSSASTSSNAQSYAGLAVFRRRPTKSKHHRGFRLQSLGILLEESRRPRPWMHLEDLKALADELYRDADRRERELEDGRGEDLLGLGVGGPGDLTEADFEPAKRWFEARRARTREKAVDVGGGVGRPLMPADVWSGWSNELDGTYASKDTPTHHLPHLLRILGLSSLTLYKFVLSRRRILIYTLPPVEVAGVLAWIASDLCREHHMASRSDSRIVFGTPMPSLFDDLASKRNKEGGGSVGVGQGKGQDESPAAESPTVLGMITLSDIPRLEWESARGCGWIACTTDAIFLEKPQYYDLVIDLTTSTPSKNSRPSLYMSKRVSGSGSGFGFEGTGTSKRKEKWKLESVRFTWSDVKLWTELDRILKLDSSQTCFHGHAHPHAAPGGGPTCCLPPPKSLSSSSSSPTPGSAQGVWADAFRLYEDVCLLCATLWMGLGTWRSNSRQSFATRDFRGDLDGALDLDLDSQGGKGGQRRAGIWGAAKMPGDEDWSLEGTHMRTLGMGIEGNPALRRKDKDKDKDKGRDEDKGETTIRAVGLGIEGRPSPSSRARSKSQTYGHGHGHSRKASASSSSTLTATSAMKIPKTVLHIEAVDECENENESQDANQGGEGGRGGERGRGRELQQQDQQEQMGEESLEEDDAEELGQQNLQTTLALLQTFHANTVFWLSRLREVLPPASIVSTPSLSLSPPSPVPLPSSSPSAPGSRACARLRHEEEEVEGEEEEEEEETLVITARDLLSLDLGVLSELDAKFVEWLVEAEGYASSPAPPSSVSVTARNNNSDGDSKIGGGRRRRRRRVVVKRGWQELFGILLGLK